MTSALSSQQLTAALSGLPGAHRAAVGSLAIQVRAPSFPAAVELVGAVARVAERMNHHPDIDIRWRTARFTLSTHSEGGVTELDLKLAGEILRLAAEGGAEVLPVTGRVEICLDAANPKALQPFWQTGLGYRQQVTEQGTLELQDPAGFGPVLWFQVMDPPRTQRGRFHLDVYLPGPDALQRVHDVVAAGGRLVSEEHAPDWWVLADPEGNELCVCAA